MPGRYRFIIAVGLAFFALGLAFRIFIGESDYLNDDAGPIESGDKYAHVHFQNSKLDPQMLDCARTFYVDRQISLTPIPAILESDQIGVAESVYLALKELLAGPTQDESAEGYLTLINYGVKINSVIIKKGIAYVDFNGRFIEGMGGSCAVTAIRAQIEKTAVQFGNIEKVIISANGDSENILQP